ncbi:MAG TPA: ABC transporter permease subunit [Ilumatobacteraceae bacterium]|nr:ABC transporter permease subunit [Ilumatobacteraceae bacterium]
MNRTRLLAPIAGLVVFFSAWEALVRAFDIRPFVLAKPSRIVRYLAQFPDDYLRASLTTMRHATLGFAVAIVVALMVGAVMAASSFLEQATQPVLTLIAVTPFAAYIGSVKIGLGAFSEKPVIFIVALVSLPAFTFAAADGMRGADPSSRELLASVDASAWEVMWHLRLPSALPSLFTAAKYNTGLALVVAYLAERGTGGLGEIGARAFANNEGDRLWAAILSMAILGTISLVLLNLLQRAVMGWHASQRTQRS